MIYRTTKYTQNGSVRYVRYSARKNQFHAARSAWNWGDAYVTLEEAEIPDEAWVMVHDRGEGNG
jgi:hypothetical protein